MTVLEIVKRTDHPDASRNRLCSFLISVGLHGLLAAVLWFVAYTTFHHASISLTASAAPSSGDVRFELVTKAKPVPPIAAPGPASAVESNVAAESLITKSMESDAIAENTREVMEPASIDFFGTHAYGTRFVFVLDISYSMNARDGERFKRACDELVRSVAQLRMGQSYYVFLFSWTTEEMFYKPAVQYVQVSAGHEKRLSRWIYHVSLGAGTDPRRALSLAHRMKPDALFLLSDGHFNQPRSPLSETGWIDEQGNRFKLDVQSGVERLFRDIPIHTIAFENPFTVSAMADIATATGGKFRYVPTHSHAPVDSNRFHSALRHIDQQHRNGRRPRQEYSTRLSYAREFIDGGELAYAEYLVRPLRDADPGLIANPTLRNQVLAILDAELGGTRLEEFEPVPEPSDIGAQ